MFMTQLVEKIGPFPNEVWCAIFDHMPIKELPQMALSKAFHQIACDHFATVQARWEKKNREEQRLFWDGKEVCNTPATKSRVLWNKVYDYSQLSLEQYVEKKAKLETKLGNLRPFSFTTVYKCTKKWLLGLQTDAEKAEECKKQRLERKWRAKLALLTSPEVVEGLIIKTIGKKPLERVAILNSHAPLARSFSDLLDVFRKGATLPTIVRGTTGDKYPFLFIKHPPDGQRDQELTLIHADNEDWIYEHLSFAGRFCGRISCCLPDAHSFSKLRPFFPET